MITAAFFISFAIRCLVSARLTWKGWLFRLPCFSLFCVISCVQSALLSVNLSAPPKYIAIQSAFGPFMTVLQIAAGLEAFVWLARCLPNFVKPGSALLAAIIFASVIIERWSAPSGPIIEGVYRCLAFINRGVGIGLGLALIFALMAFSAFPRVPSSARWHAACLAAIGLGNGLGWQLLSRWTIMVSIIMAFSAWLVTVDHPPTWKEIEPGCDPHKDRLEQSIRRAEESAGI